VQASESEAASPEVAVEAGLIEVEVDSDHAGGRLDSVLAEQSGASRSQIRRWIEDGRVRVGDTVARKPNTKVQAGDRLFADPPEPEESIARPEAIPIEVVYEDADLIVIDKAAGMVVHPAPGHADGTLVNALLHHCGDLAGIGGVIRPGIVHRLDRGTSGIIVAAKNDTAHERLSKQFQDHSIERVYNAFVRGVPRVSEGRIEASIGRHPRDRKKMSTHSHQGRSATTVWRVLERFPASNQCRFGLHPETGRTHQLRVHLASIGMPIYGDTVYGRGRSAVARHLPRLDRPALHAAVLGFDHPRTGTRHRFEAPLPADLLELEAALRAAESGDG
jgi:23S rRNA pseudouridine1911/1915/1917 synthase